MIELLVVVAILAVFVSVAAVNIISGTASAKVSAGVRGVVQMARYARTMALLKQRPVAVTFGGSGTIEVAAEDSNDGLAGSEKDEVGSLAAPVSFAPGAESGDMRLAAFTVQSPDGGEDGEDAEGDAGGGEDKLASDRDSRKYEGVTFEVEILDETGSPVDLEYAKDFPGVRLPGGDAAGGGGGDGEDGYDSGDDSVSSLPTVGILYETTGKCQPFRVTVRRAGYADGPGRVVTVDRFGRARESGEDDR